MPLDLQIRLLRVLQTGEFYRIDGNTLVKVNIRIIAATNQNLQELVTQKLFREDLYHRLSVINIHLPKLSERTEDIPLLTDHFLKIASTELNVSQKYLNSEVLKVFLNFSWPGNIRQLENLCKYLTAMTPSNEINLFALPIEMQNKHTERSLLWERDLKKHIKMLLNQNNIEELKFLKNKSEKILINEVLKWTKNNKKETAQLINMRLSIISKKINEKNK